jgi:hypothetical protein
MLPRPPHPAPTFVTMANAPHRDGMAQTCRDDLPDEQSEKYFAKGLDTPIKKLPVGQIT